MNKITNTAINNELYAKYLHSFHPKEAYNSDIPIQEMLGSGRGLLSELDNISSYVHRLILYFQNIPEEDLNCLLNHINKTLSNHKAAFLKFYSENADMYKYSPKTTREKFFFVKTVANYEVAKKFYPLTKHKEEEILATLAVVLTNELITSLNADKKRNEVFSGMVDDMRRKIDEITGKPKLWVMPYFGFSDNTVSLASDVAAVMEKAFPSEDIINAELRKRKAEKDKKGGEANRKHYQEVKEYCRNKATEIKSIKPTWKTNGVASHILISLKKEKSDLYEKACDAKRDKPFSKDQTAISTITSWIKDIIPTQAKSKVSK